MESDRKNEGWLAHYYQKLQTEYQFSLNRRDNITNWALTLFLAVIATYSTILAGQIVVSGLWRIAFLFVTLGLVIRFFFQSMISYSFLRRWRYLENRVESFWITGHPTIQEIMKDIQRYDHGRRTDVSKASMLWSQLRAGFLLIFFVLFGLVYLELIQLMQITTWLYVLFLAFCCYVLWECTVFLTYDQLKRPTSEN